VEKTGQKLENFATLDSDSFVAEVRKRRAKGAGTLFARSFQSLVEGRNPLGNTAMKILIR